MDRGIWCMIIGHGGWRRAAGGMLAAVLMVLAAPTVLAQDVDAAQEVQPLAASGGGGGVSKTLYEALLGNVRSDTIASLLRDVIRAEGEACPYVTDYQVFKAQTGMRELKVKCKERQLFSVTVRSDGGVTLAGGNGVIGPMFPKDGYITSLTGQRIDDYLNDQARETGDGAAVSRPPAATELSKPAAASAGSSHRLSSGWIAVIVLFNLMVVAVLVLALDRFFRPSKDVYAKLTSKLANLRSADKDALISESREVYNNIYAHPDGYFIARGAHGKRRIFPTLIAAILYRDYRVKIREIKTD